MFARRENERKHTVASSRRPARRENIYLCCFLSLACMLTRWIGWVEEPLSTHSSHLFVGQQPVSFIVSCFPNQITRLRYHSSPWSMEKKINIESDQALIDPTANSIFYAPNQLLSHSSRRRGVFRIRLSTLFITYAAVARLLIVCNL